MENERPAEELVTNEMWRKALVEGEVASKLLRTVFRLTPAAPRCGLCYVPFTWMGRILGLTAFARSRKNPLFCQMCFEKAPHGGAEVDTGILFADVRGFTSWSESRAPQEVAALVNRLYRVATAELSTRYAVIDKLAGDEVMALFVPGFAGERYIERMIDAAEALLRGVGFGSSEGAWLPLGIGLGWGNAFVGNVGADEVKDFTAIGDVVNTSARLQSQAQPGQIVMSERVYERARERFPNAERIELTLKGKSEPVAARVADVT